MSKTVQRTIHIPQTLADQFRDRGVPINNALWVALLRERLAVGHFMPLKVEEWRPGERRDSALRV